MDSTDNEQPLVVTSRRVFCNGGELGHPGVYLNLGDDGKIACPYCSRHFVLAEGAQAEHGH